MAQQGGGAAAMSLLPMVGACQPAAPPGGTPPDGQVQPSVERLSEDTTDLLGLYQTAPDYRTVIEAGARVVNVPELGTFFVVWVPDGYAAQELRRVLLAAHGSRGNACAEIGKELELAGRYGYGLAAPQWWLPDDDRYFEPDEVYGLICLALEYLQSRYGAAPFDGTHFFMYCGMQDRYWGPEQCEQMHNAERLMRQYGATIEAFIEDPLGGHAGLRENPEYHERAIQTFLRLTAD